MVSNVLKVELDISLTLMDQGLSLALLEFVLQSGFHFMMTWIGFCELFNGHIVASNNIVPLIMLYDEQNLHK